MKTKEITLSALILTFSISLKFLMVLSDLPVSLMLIIVFYPILNRFLWVYFSFDTLYYVYRLGFMVQGALQSMQGSEQSNLVLDAMNANQILVSIWFVYVIVFLISSISFISTLKEIGYYERFSKIYTEFKI